MHANLFILYLEFLCSKNYEIFELALESRVADSRDPRVNDAKTEQRRLRSHGSSTASSPAVRSSPRDLRDLAHRLSYTVEPLVGVSNGGGAHGGTEVQADGETPMEAMAAPTKAWTCIS